MKGYHVMVMISAAFITLAIILEIKSCKENGLKWYQWIKCRKIEQSNDQS